MARRSSSLGRETLAFVLAGGRGSRIREMTDNRCKPAVHFGGKMRIIDFALSNAVNSNIRKIALATQYKSHSLIRHCHSTWNFMQRDRDEVFDILPASQRTVDGSWYKGTADAVYQNLDIIDDYDVKYVLILAGDHIYKMDYEVMLQQHVETGAGMTIGCLTVDRNAASAFGVLDVDDQGWVRQFDEKPLDPMPTLEDDSKSLVSMGIYVFEWKSLREILIADANDETSGHDFGNDIIPRMVNDGRVSAHRFSDSCVLDGVTTEYWRDVGTLDAYWQANIDLTDFTPELNLYSNRWPIWTVNTNAPPAKFIHDSDDRRGVALSSLISHGCIISGAEVRRSLLSLGVHVNSFASLDQCVVNPEAKIQRFAKLRRTIVDRGVEIPKGLMVGYDPDEDRRWFRVTDNGITLITQEMLATRAQYWS
ncbi:glucose-1-phosphate adenylyltransferase [Marivita sp.]|uniref:glucose-1-phosphate adenylyltransferase n=1 Tax=Marivita sp. TaxID=2003365 RepID=UPI003219B18D